MSRQSGYNSSEGPSNDVIRTQVVRMYADFVSDVDPRGGLLDWLIQEEVVTLEMKERVVAEPSTSRERCRRLLDALFASSNPRAFVVLRRALIREKKSWLVERIDCAAVTVTVTATPAADAAARPLNDVDASKTREAELQNELTAAKQEIEALKKQLRKTQQGDSATVVRRKLVIVGDGATGKSCLLNVFRSGKFPAMYEPTVYESFTVRVDVDDTPVDLSLWDTAGQDAYKRLRPMSYPSTDVFVICFSVVNRDSLLHVTGEWMPELTPFTGGGKTPVVLVGNMIDLRQQTQETHQVSSKEGRRVADDIGAAAYCECSALTSDGVRDMFETCVRLTRQHRPTASRGSRIRAGSRKHVCVQQ